MTQTNIFAKSPSVSATGLHPSPNFLMSVVVTILAPLFLGVTGGDAVLARMAAAETINDFRARNNMDLIAVVQIITNGLAALDSLCRSMGDDLPLSMTLRLRGNAISLNHAAEQNRRVLREKRDAGPVLFYPASVPKPEPPVAFADNDTSSEQTRPLEQDGSPGPEMLMNDVAVQLLAAEAEARLLHPVEQAADPMPPEHAAPGPAKPAGNTLLRRMRARAMIQEAGDLTDSLPTLPPAERRDAEVRIAALGSRVRELLTGMLPAMAADSPDRDDAVAMVADNPDCDDAVTGDYRFIAPPSPPPTAPTVLGHPECGFR